MQSPKIHIPYEPKTKCSVQDCPKHADYEVYLYDYYPPPINEEFFEQDFTCPFLCESHMQENEDKADGIRQPRGSVIYPHSNRGEAQGYTKYMPVREAYPIFFDGSSSLLIPENRLVVSSANDGLIKYLAKHPELLYTLEPRKFEELVAEIFRDKGYNVELTPKTRDGGKDIYAIRKEPFGSLLYVIECKRYASSNKVGVEVVRGLYGVTQAEKATMGIIATTSTFTSTALDFAAPLKYQLSLRDYDALQEWLSEYSKS